MNGCSVLKGEVSKSKHLSGFYEYTMLKMEAISQLIQRELAPWTFLPHIALVEAEHGTGHDIASYKQKA